MQLSKIVVKPFGQCTRKFFSVNEGLPSENILAAGFDSNGRLWAGTDKGAAYIENGRFTVSNLLKGAVQVIYKDLQGRLWLACGGKVITSDGEHAQSFNSDIVGISQDHLGNLRLMTQTDLYTYINDSFVHTVQMESGVKATGMAAFADGETFVTAPDALFTVFGKRARWFALTPESSSMPHTQAQAVAGDKYGMVWVGTPDGLVVYDSHNCWLTKKQIDALTSYNVKKLLLGSSGRRYVGTDIGLLVYDGAARHFYGAGRWLPAPEVTAIAESDDGTQVFVGTKNGLSLLEAKLTTFEEKAAHYQQLTEKYNVRDMGFVTSRCLKDENDYNSGNVDISDNDGLWTGCYMASQCYRYAVTKSESALKEARRSMKSMLKLMSVTGIPGFTARAIRRPGEDGFGNGHHEWTLSSDERGELEWKGETSSDEMVGHFFSSSIFFDLCADEAEKKEISAALCAITDHIISNDFRLHDKDGKPTTWANWNPADLNRSDRWYWEHGINALEMLAFLKIAHHMSGNEKYEREYNRLITQEHYALNSAYHKCRDAHTCHIDDNLGFLITIPLLTYETDPALRQCYMFGLRNHWEYERIERCPLWSFIYAALTGECSDLDRAVQSLKELPTELVTYQIVNSVRNDLVWDEGQDEYGEPPQLKRPLPYDEKPLNKYDGNPFRADTTHKSLRLLDGTLFLLPYWFGRYYGLIEG